MNIVTYNILHPYFAVKHNLNDGIVSIDNDVTMDNWHLRKNTVINNLKNTSFSVCCLQEVSPRICKELSKEFKCAGFETHRTDEGECGKQGVAVFYDPAKVKLLAVGKFQSLHDWWRAKVCCDFKDKKSGKVVRVMSVHLKRYNPNEIDPEKKQKSKLQGLQELMFFHIAANNMNVKRIDTLVIAGDLNEGIEGVLEPLSRIKLLQDLGYKIDNNFKLTEKATSRKIDWIFCKQVSKKGGFILSPLEFAKEDPSGSDHLMAGTLINFKKNSI